MKVLIVEDDPTTAHLMKYVVGKHATFQHANNGQQAYDEFCTALDTGEPFDLVFLDIMMPIADGQEVLKAIREYEEEHGIFQSQAAKVVMTTCLNDNREVFEALSAGAMDYLTKPIRKEKLERILSRIGKECDGQPNPQDPEGVQ